MSDKDPSSQAVQGQISRQTAELLRLLGENPRREGLLKTPERVAKSLAFLTHGYGQDLKTVLNDAVFKAEDNAMVIVKDIEVYSLCEHHLLPFFGKCHVGYIPRKKIIGVSKIPRLVDMYARRLQVQERLTTQISDALAKVLDPYGVAVVIEAKHLCMMMRGVEKQNSEMVTSSMKGVFRKGTESRMEFLDLIRKRA